MSTDHPREGASAHGHVYTPAGFIPSPWLPGPHLPTLWGSICRRPPPLQLHFERVELSDGDFLDLAWTTATLGDVVVVLHGLEGSHRSGYARAMLSALHGSGYRGVLMQFRGCSGEPNRLDRSYHSGDTADLAAIAALLERRYGEPPVAVIGYSVGGNVVLKWLGECAARIAVKAAVAISVPFDLAACAERLNQGFSRLYQRHLVHSLQNKYLVKFSQRRSPLDIGNVRRFNTFRSFDDAVTAPLHGFRNAAEYYRLSSCRPYLRHITVPTLIVHAHNDPFVPARAIPQAAELGAATTLELGCGGGHVGFCTAPAAPAWLEPRIVEFLRSARTPVDARG